MQVKVLRNLGRGFPQLTEGQVADLDEQTAERLVKQGLAEVVVRAVPQEPIKAIQSADESAKKERNKKADA
jgi:hypothetical protein